MRKKLKCPLSGKSQDIMIFTKVSRRILHGYQGAFLVVVVVLNSLIISVNSTLIQISETNWYYSIIIDNLICQIETNLLELLSKGYLK